MSRDSRILSIPGHAELHVRTRSGRVSIVAEERSDVSVESDAPLRDDKVEVDPRGRASITSSRGGSGWLEIRCPAGTDVGVGTVSGNVELAGPLGAVKVITVSGHIEVERAETLDARSVAGSIEVSSCVGRCQLQTKSGRAICGTAAEAQASTLSGMIRLAQIAGNVSAQSVSGKIDIGMRSAGDVKVQTMSGAVTVAVPHGMKPAAHLRSMTTRPRVDVEEGNDFQIRVQSLSGKIEVVPS
ncbi:MAG: DUF4097 family beta strand repeat-containing protein [Dehalococcoidia bacterium]